MKVLSRLVLPLAQRGWCQITRVQAFPAAARSSFRHLSCSEPTPQPVRAHCSELTATTCQEPMVVEYQPFPAVPARGPKYWKYPAALAVPYSWLPGTG